MQWLIDNLYIFWTEVYVTNFGKKLKLLLTELMLLLLLLVTKSCPTCNHMDCSPLGSSVLRQQYWSGLPFPSPGDLPDPGIKPASSALASGFFTTKPQVSLCLHAKSLQSCPILCDPMDCSLPGSSVHGILQTRILEWVAMPSSRGSSWPRDQTRISCSSSVAGRFFTNEPPGKPRETCTIC